MPPNAKIVKSRVWYAFRHAFNGAFDRLDHVIENVPFSPTSTQLKIACRIHKDEYCTRTFNALKHPGIRLKIYPVLAT
jgi:hypothetical protein